MSKTYPIDPTEPEGGANPKLGDDSIRTLAAAVVEFLQKNHYTGSANVNGGYDDDAAGEHTKITFNAPLANDPSNTANKGDLYIKDVNGTVELFWQDEVSANDAVQLTSGGKILLASGLLTNNVALKSKNAAGSGTVDLLKANASDVVEVPAALKVGGKITNVTAPDDDTDAANKAYVSTAIGARKGQQVQVTSSAAITAGTGYQDMEGMSITITTTGGNVLLMLSANIRLATDNGGGYIRFVYDSTAVGENHISYYYADQALISHHYLITNLAAGEHTFKVQWKKQGTMAAGGTGHPRNFTVIEYPS